MRCMSPPPIAYTDTFFNLKSERTNYCFFDYSNKDSNNKNSPKNQMNKTWTKTKEIHDN
jgi:hypothetical protein